MNIRVVFMGTPDFAVPILETLLENTKVVLVVSQPDKCVGRKKEIKFSPVKVKAMAENILVFQPENIKKDYQEIKDIKPDLIVTCAYGQIVPMEVLDIPRLGCINVHASILPKYRGGAPIHHAIMNGDKETGVSIMYMDVGMDTGDIIEIAKIPINSTDTVEVMHDKLSVLGADLLKKVLPSIILGTNKRIKQNEDEVSYAPIIKREDEHLDFNNEAQDIDNKVRGLNSWPLANFVLEGEEIKVIEGYVGEKILSVPGKIIKITKDAIGIACRDKIFYVTKLKPSGKKAMSTKDYLNGVKKENLLNKVVK